MRNGKRILSLALLVLLVVLLTPVAAHADPPKGDTHLHSWSVVSETPATCTSPGTKTWRCSACGDTYTEQTSPPLGHDFGNAATAGSPGRPPAPRRAKRPGPAPAAGRRRPTPSLPRAILR